MEWAPLALVSVLGVTAVVALVALVMTLSRKGRSETAARAYLLGVNYVLSGDPDAAIAELSRVAQLNTQTLETYFALGALFRRKGELDRALRLHQNMLLRPGLAPEVRRRAQLALAQDYRRGGLLGRSAEVLDKLLEESPDHPEGLIELRRIREETGEWEEAARIQHRLLERDPEGGRRILAHHLSALARSQRKDAPPEALALAARAVELWPRSADAQLTLGELRVEQGEPGKGAEALVEAVRLDPELAVTHFGLLCQAMGASTLDAALRGMLGEGGARQGPYELAVALCQARAGQVEAAVARLKQLVDQRPRFWEARKELGVLLLALDRSEEVRADYEEILGTLGQAPLGFVCRACGQKQPQRAHRCPSCGEWDTVAREDGEGPRI
ncbi:MAG: tetratricopeptide repeat protein [Myxococcota bacterium]|nr:tetratricopeptide repeat protein [Myxococcota bacterium]